MKAHAWLLGITVALASCNGPPSQTPADPQDAKSPAPADFHLPATGALSLSDLSNFAKLERDYVKADDFSKGFDDSPIKGRQFVVEFDAPKYGGSSTTMISWGYDADKGALSVSVDPTSAIQSHTDMGPKKKMHNAFGTEIDAETMETWEIKLGEGSEQRLGVFPEIDSMYSMTGANHGLLSFTLHLAPEQARQLTKTLRLRLEGNVLVPSANGRTLACSTDSHSATLEYPLESTTHTCEIYVQYSRVAVLSSNGQTLHEWIDYPSKANRPKSEAAIEPSGDIGTSGDDEESQQIQADSATVQPTVDENDNPLGDMNTTDGNDAGD